MSSTESIPAQSTGDAGATGRPLVSVIMATYNRSNIIGYSIRSLLASTLQDWELIVVGDACTDDTEAVVAAFSDPRIRFINLERNCGEQSGPNNAGVALARGRYVAFLNHDDLWLPGHLAALLGAIEVDRADLAFSIGMIVVGDGQVSSLAGAVTTTGRYHTAMSVPASLWLMRKELALQVGPWRSAFDLHVAPSQDWLHRAHCGGANLRAVPEVTALLITSGGTRDSYAARLSQAHEHYFARYRAPDFVARALLDLQLHWEDLRWYAGGWRLVLEGVKGLGRQCLRRLGVFPSAPRHFLLPRSKGTLIRRLRRTRGLDSI